MVNEALLADLDDDQRRAVTCPPTATIVHAGAGSGKTRVLTHRIAWRIAEGTADPSRVLAITFTREAAAEMRRRLRALGVVRNHRPGDTDSPTIGTFHAVALGLLRRRASDTSATMPNIVGNRLSLLQEAIGDKSALRQRQLMLAEIDWAHARMIPPERYAFEVQRAQRSVSLDAASVAAAYLAYEQLKRRRGLVDLDDLLSLATRAIHDRSDFAAATRFRFRHLFVDEAQDMNPLQYAFFEALRGDRADVFVVGDPLQAIYGWNGADPALFTSLPDALPNPTVLSLPNNYRCSPQVLSVATHVARHNGTEPEVRARRANGLPAVLIEAADEDDELAQAFDIVVRHADRSAHGSRGVRGEHGSRGAPSSPVAVLARTHQQLEPLARWLERSGVAVASRRVDAARATAIDEVSDCRDRHDLAVWAADVLIESENDAQREVAGQVQEFLRSAAASTVDGRTAAAWLRAAQHTPDTSGVELLTFHGAKGREFSVVVIIGADRGLLPHANASSPAQLAEEARLAYVACTRAADHLYIVRARRRRGRAATISQFFADLPSDVERADSQTSSRPTDLPRLSTPRDASGLANDDLRRRLRLMRDDIARINFCLPEVVLSDAEIRRIVDERPADLEHLARILGPLTAQRLGASILRETVAFA